jgi:hypothetical protein
MLNGEHIMAVESKNLVTKYSLGLEELALALGLINRPDLGRDLLKAYDESLTAEQVGQRLLAAGHSLMARGLSGISSEGHPRLSAHLEQAVFPLARYDSLLHMSIVRQGTQASTTIHVLQGRMFTSHFAVMGVVQVLEYGPYEALLAFLEDPLEDFLGGSSIPSKGNSGHIHLDLLGENTNQDQAAIQSALTAEGWASDWASWLAEDLSHQVCRATLLHVATTADDPIELAQNAPTRSLLMLRGPERSWQIKFSTIKDNPLGSARLVNSKAFKQTLASFVQSNGLP